MGDGNDFEVISRIIRSRRAIYPVQYANEDIHHDFIDQLLELANWAPTHRRTEPWRYIVLSGAAKQRLGEFLADRYEKRTTPDSFKPSKKEKIIEKCDKSQYIMLIILRRDPAERVPEWEEIAALAMSVQNMWLACSAEGVGCYWSTPATKDDVHEFVTLQPGEQCMGFFYIGSFDGDWPEGHRTPMVDKVRYLTA